MHRTRLRLLPAGMIAPGAAFATGTALVALGLIVLARGANHLTAFLALVVEVVYLAGYTPLKPRTPLNTLVGSVCGAIPPVMGWTAATGHIDFGAWILAALLFLWQVPHFLSLAWLYRTTSSTQGAILGGLSIAACASNRGSSTSVAAAIRAYTGVTRVQIPVASPYTKQKFASRLSGLTT